MALGFVETSGDGPDFHWSRGFSGCDFSLALPTGILDASGVDDDAASRWVCSWFAESSNGILLVGSHVLVVVAFRDLGLWASSSHFCLLGCRFLSVWPAEE